MSPNCGLAWKRGEISQNGLVIGATQTYYDKCNSTVVHLIFEEGEIFSRKKGWLQALP
jgi:hypothetical protein